MSTWFVLILMLFLHIVDDYYLQAVGVLAMMKQRSWWKKEAPQKMYRYDYLVALLMHSFSWAFMVMLPVAAYLEWNPPGLFYILFAVNVLVHGIVDHAKANLLKINLIVDQSIHIAQIVVTYLILI